MPSGSVNYTFQPKPESITILAGSGSYVVPSGKFVRASCTVYDGTSISINGSTVLSSNQWDAISHDGVDGNLFINSPAISGQLPTFTGAAGRSGLAVNDQTVAGLTGAATGIKVFKNQIASDTQSMDYWLPAGATVSAAGGGTAVIQVFSG